MLHFPFDVFYPLQVVGRREVDAGLCGRPVAEPLDRRGHLPGIEVPARPQPLHIPIRQLVVCSPHEQFRIARPFEILPFDVFHRIPGLHGKFAQYGVQSKYPFYYIFFRGIRKYMG